MSKIQEYRAEIEELDCQILKRLICRCQLVEKIQKIKQEQGLISRDLEREEQILAGLNLHWWKNADQSLSQLWWPAIEAFYYDLFEVAHASQASDSDSDV